MAQSQHNFPRRSPIVFTGVSDQRFFGLAAMYNDEFDFLGEVTLTTASDRRL
jgi:hypothetical protein